MEWKVDKKLSLVMNAAEVARLSNVIELASQNLRRAGPHESRWRYVGGFTPEQCQEFEAFIDQLEHAFTANEDGRTSE
jgi:muconolactone delta-isomerase